MHAIVTDDGRFPHYWARELVGQERELVEVTYNGHTFYLDNEADPRNPESQPGAAWRKVTAGAGSPGYGHREVAVDPGSVRA